MVYQYNHFHTKKEKAICSIIQILNNNKRKTDPALEINVSGGKAGINHHNDCWIL